MPRFTTAGSEKQETASDLERIYWIKNRIITVL